MLVSEEMDGICMLVYHVLSKRLKSQCTKFSLYPGRWKSWITLARSGGANSFPRIYILHVCPERKYNDEMIDIHYLNAHWMESDRFTALKMYMWRCSDDNM